MTPPINSVEEACAEVWEASRPIGGTFWNELPQPQRNFAMECYKAGNLAARRAANTPVDGWQEKAERLAESIWWDQDEVRKATNLTDAWHGITIANGKEILEFAQAYASCLTSPAAEAVAWVNGEKEIMRSWLTRYCAELRACGQIDDVMRLERIFSIAISHPAPSASRGVTEARAALLAEVIALIEDDMYGPGEAEDSPTRTEFNKALRRQINRITSRLVVKPATLPERGM